MHGYYNRKHVRSRTLSLDKGARQNNTPLPQSKAASENGHDMSISYHMLGLVRAIRKRFRAMSLPSQIVLALFAFYLMSVIVNMLIQLIIGSMALIYTILGILASAIVIYDFFMKKR